MASQTRSMGLPGGPDSWGGRSWRGLRRGRRSSGRVRGCRRGGGEGGGDVGGGEAVVEELGDDAAAGDEVDHGDGQVAVGVGSWPANSAG